VTGSSGTLFPIAPELPEGFAYQSNFLSAQEESELLESIRSLAFQPVDFQGYTARRRAVQYGLEYDFSTRQASTTNPFPDFLLSLRARAAHFAGLQPEDLVESIVIEYVPGAPMGWHRDAPQFGTVVGISLANDAQMRFRPYVGSRKPGERLKSVSLTLESRSIYVMRGPARWRFQHSVPPVPALRYSITFRTLRGKETKADAA